MDRRCVAVTTRRLVLRFACSARKQAYNGINSQFAKDVP
jgi:hypothetical protein